MALPTVEQVLHDGGWDVRYARVLAIGGGDDIAVALVDTNGDGAVVEQCLFHRLPDGGWREGSTSGYGTTGFGVHTTWETNGHVLATGRAKGREPITLVVGNVELTAEPGEGGWWVAAERAPGSDP